MRHANDLHAALLGRVRDDGIVIEVQIAEGTAARVARALRKVRRTLAWPDAFDHIRVIRYDCPAGAGPREVHFADAVEDVTAEEFLRAFDGAPVHGARG